MKFVPKGIQKAFKHSKQAAYTCTTVERTSDTVCEFCQKIYFCLSNMIEKACIDPRDWHILPDTVTSPQKIFVKLPPYSYFVQNEIDIKYFFYQNLFLGKNLYL